MDNMKLYAGTSGMVLPYKNQGFYPEIYQGKSRLEVYSHILNSLEVNSIFYKLPQPATIARWNEQVDEAFRFTFKLWKEVTHSPSLDFSRQNLMKYIEVITPAVEKAGCLLVQFPPSVSFRFFKKVDSLLQEIQDLSGGAWPLAVEFRNPGWYKDEVYELMDACKATMVYHDKRGSESPQPQLAADHIYLRFHGPSGDYKGSYDNNILHEYAGYIKNWLNTDKTVYIYFNNTMGGALANVQFIRDMVNKSV